ncbi:MAG: hypothetical protein JSV61_14255 [Anaerolineales bacterium]|nr:MAG: hypothetical protein JSV61_14255 [Anaerolineales bacterium]
MNIKHLPARIEVTLWLAVISLMSESVLLQRSLRQLYFYKVALERDHNYLRVLAWSSAGLLLGLLLGLVTA